MGASELLRLLEPAVRPIGAVGPAAPVAPGRQPIEQQSFEALLEAARAEAAGDEQASQEKPAATASPLTSLAQVDRIENASLRALMQGRREG